VKRKRLAALLVATCAAGALTGCIVFVKFTLFAVQLNTIGNVELSSDMCGSDKDASHHPGCQDPDVEGGDSDGNLDTDANDSSHLQILIGYRVPTGSTGPASFTTDFGPTTVTFTRNDSYASELERLSPAPAGQHWIGYMSDPQTYDTDPDDHAAHRISVSPEFTLPRNADGSPFQGPFRWQQVIGFRGSSDDPSTTRDVNCGDTLVDLGTDATVCADHPALADIPQSKELATSDFGIVGGPSVGATRGATTSVPFTGTYVGPSAPEANFSLTASTTVPGGTATPSQPTLLPPSDSSTPINVNVGVPAGTPPGNYQVTLTASLANGETRTNSRVLTVTAAATRDTTRPGVRVSIIRGQSVASILRNALRLRERLTEPGSTVNELIVDSGFLARPVRIARKTTRYPRASTKTIRLRLNRRARSRRGRAALLRPRRVTFTLRTTARDRAGNRRRATKRFRLRRR
jgi:hypothetical protein